MKNNFLITIFLVFTMFFGFNFISTQASGMIPFGLRIIAPIPGVICPNGASPYTAQLASFNGPYLPVVTNPASSFKSQKIGPGAWALGFYQATPITCTLDGAPFPANLLIRYGTSSLKK